MKTRTVAIASLMLSWAPGAELRAQAPERPPPLIASIEPTRVPLTGGIRVVIAGENFTPGLTVRLCGSLIKDATWVTKNQVEFVSPQREAGACEVSVTNPDGQSARIRTVFAFSDAPSGVMVGALVPAGPTPLGAPLPPPGLSIGTGAMRPAPSAAQPGAVRDDLPGPDRVAAEFMGALVRTEDTARLHHLRMRSTVSPGVVFGHAFSDAFPAYLAGLPLVHFEGRLESVNLAGQRLWFPFVLHVTQERPARVTGFAISANPAGTRESLVRTIEIDQGTDIVVDLTRPLRPLP